MLPTFMGLETAKRGMSAQQGALSVLGHNVANANTDGYSRQRVNLQASSPFPSVGFDKPYMPGQIGTGVDTGSVQRVRNSFLDVQYRGDNSKLGYYSSRSDALSRMQDIMNEPSDQGLAKTMDQFWQSLQDLSTNAQDSGARSVVLERGKAVADTFNYLSNSLSTIQGDLKSQIGIETKNVNSLLDQIQALNKQIADVEPHGMLPNDLYDQRDLLLDQLSNLVNIKVSYSSSGGNSLQNADGKVSVDLVDANGKSLGTLIDGTDVTTKPNYLTVNYDSSNLVSSIDVGTPGTKTIDIKDFTSMGKIKSLIDSYGSEATATDPNIITYASMLNKLDDMASAFADAFNTAHKQGTTLTKSDPNDPNSSYVQGGDFFTIGNTTDSKITAANIQVSKTLGINDIAASKTSIAGDGSNASSLADVLKVNTITIGTGAGAVTSTIDSYYQGIIGGMGVNAQQADRLTSNTQTLVDSVNQNRLSVSSVSLDEEMTDMVKFQHAYNASARMITAIDEMLDKIINSMGVVGR